MKFCIAVPTKSRVEVLKKFLRRVGNPKYTYVITVEKSEWDLYKDVRESHIYVNWLRIADNSGVGYARRVLAEWSIRHGFDYTFFSDDNAYWSINKLHKFITVIHYNPHIHWLSGYNAFYKLMHKKDCIRSLYTTDVANVVYVLRNTTLSKRNFNPAITYNEDNYLNLAWRKLLYPLNVVYVYKGFTFTKKRHEQGGCTSYKTHKNILRNVQLLQQCHGKDIVKLRIKDGHPEIRICWYKLPKPKEVS